MLENEPELAQNSNPEPKSFKKLVLAGMHQAFDYTVEIVRVVVISLAIILPIRYFLVQPFYVKGASMEPNFYDHEYLVIDELSYRLRAPVRGEIVVFRYPVNPSQFFIKRIIGLPGEEVEIKNGVLKIKNADYPNGVKLEELYLGEETQFMVDRDIKLGEQEYFVLGDNRQSSLDSRVFGAVPRNLMVGKVWLRGWPFDRVAHFVTPEYALDMKDSPVGAK